MTAASALVRLIMILIVAAALPWKAYMFSSPSVAGDVVFIGVLNGTLEARDTKTGELLWDFQVDTSKKNKGWVLTAASKFNGPFLFHSNWREAPIVATDEQIRIGGIFSSPLVVNGVVYFGSADGFLYALEQVKFSCARSDQQDS
jgi:eukaryotic-like serine/threonine-protein kinase